MSIYCHIFIFYFISDDVIAVEAAVVSSTLRFFTLSIFENALGEDSDAAVQLAGRENNKLF